ncbi:PKD domain-containing protein [Flavihumibacter sp. ZG627]|uniref:PKD domain-containing protein n=1 Tax=Flavihumibacter sp. ZG627 TaxID=1463156 RepID=UPI00057D4742|nr:PKD domain-containing protein [Flavihumibacter sp. ZG627]KIC91472.1 hypothetical protein HY58_04305 [Flavihumibacter sp. ZG627]
MRLLTQAFGMPMFTLVNCAASVKKSFYLFLTSFLIFGWGIAVGQSPCNVKPNDNCTSGDITIQSVVLVDAAGNPLSSNCTPGSQVTAYLKVNFNVTSNERYGFLITGRVYINEQHVQVIDECYAQTFSSGPKSVVLLNDPVTWTCGATIELRDVFTAWDNNAPAIVNGSPVYAVCTYYNSTTRTYNCASLTPKCFYYPTPIKVVGPLIANFGWSGSCNTGNIAQTIAFTNLTTGGTTPYTYTWNFGDGSATSSIPNPTHTYASAGNYTVTLTANDASNPTKQDVQSYVVAVASCCIAPSITTQPTNKTVCQGATTSFTVAHSGGFPTPNIQWQVSINNGTSFTNLSNVGIYSGTTTTTLTLTGVSNIQNGYLYRAVLTSGSCSPVNSAPASLTVTADPTITLDAPNTTVCIGGDATITATAANGTGTCTIQWQSSTNNTEFTDIPNENGETFAPSTATPGTMYYRATYSCTGNGCGPATADPVTITVDAQTNGGTLTGAKTVCEGSTSGQLSLTGQVGTIQRWESSPTGDAPWTTIAHTAATYTSDALSADTWFRVIVKSGVCAEAASNAVRITVEPTPVIVINQPEAVCAPGVVDLSTTISEEGTTSGLTYTYWRTYLNNVLSNEITGSDIQNINQSGTYYVKGTSALGCYAVASIDVTSTNCNGLIYPTSTTCNSFLNGQPPLDKICITRATKGNRSTISNATPGVFFYYTSIVAPAASFTVDIIQYNVCNPTLKPFSIQKGQVFGFSSECTKIATGAEVRNQPGNATISFTGLTPGQMVVISVKYDTKSIIGGTMPTANCQFYFISKVNGVVDNNTAGNILVSECKAPLITVAAPSIQGTLSDVPESIILKAYPNPYLDEVNFNFISPVSDKATIEMYDLLGRKVAIAFSGNVNAGVTNSVKYRIHGARREPLFYRLVIGSHIVTGKLIPGSK